MWVKLALAFFGVIATLILVWLVFGALYNWFSRVRRDKRELLQLREEVAPMIDTLRTRNYE